MLKRTGAIALATAIATAFLFGSAGSSEAAKRKKAAPKPAAAASMPNVYMNCGGGLLGMDTRSGAVCATKGGQKFTYANACFASRDGAKSAKTGACAPAKKMKKAGKKKSKKK